MNGRAYKIFIKSEHKHRLYIFLSVTSILIMVISGYITNGYREREVLVSLKEEPKKSYETRQGISVNADLSMVPNDIEIKRILNTVMPDVCKDCDKKPLACLDQYEMNKIIVKNKEYKDQLIVEILTGEKKYITIIDLVHNNSIISSSGEIDKKECKNLNDNEETITADVIINSGDDPIQTDYITVQ